MEYTIKSSYYYDEDGRKIMVDKYPLKINSDNKLTANQLKEKIKKELLPRPTLTITEEVLKVDGVTASNSSKISEDSDLEYKVVQLAIGTIVDPKAPKK